MTNFIELVLLALLLGWTLSELMWRIRPSPLILIASYAATLLAVFALQSTPPVLILIAILSPIGLILPMAALMLSLRKLGLPLKRFTSFELVILFALFLAYILMSIGFGINWDPYRTGYTGLGAGLAAVPLALYALARGHILLLITLILAQILWLAELGSTNFYDHLGHFLLILILPTVLITRLIKRTLGPLTRRAN